MLQIDDTIISFDLFDKCFACDLAQCKGICCVEGDEGAPLQNDEIATIEQTLPAVRNYLSPLQNEIIDSQNFWYNDRFDEPVTQLVNGAACVFAIFDQVGICKCAFEKAFEDGKIEFAKPISCHLYPVRLQKYHEHIAINYHKWNVCDCALKKGKSEQMPLYRFLETPLKRRFGNEWYEKLEIAAKETIEYR
ncbi:MAG: DUF3109 family protein [Paludibacter sp.]|jgi:hypothetical protein|nr:DUF3109 family protein [Paludibacter sp.]